MRSHRRGLPKRGSRDEPLGADPDAATLRSLARLAGGDPSRFARHTQPPEAIQEWIDGLDLPGTNALLIHAVRRWHTLGGDR